MSARPWEQRLAGKASRLGHHFDYLVGPANDTMRFIGLGTVGYLLWTAAEFAAKARSRDGR